MLRFGERIGVFVVRPFYRAVVARPLWWFISRVKAYFLAEISPQLESIGRQLEHERHLLATIEGRLHSIEDRLHGIENGNNSQWDALEQLLLALYRQPEVKLTEPNSEAVRGNNDQSRTHAAGHIR
jgi:hypothetical protein